MAIIPVSVITQKRHLNACSNAVFILGCGCKFSDVSFCDFATFRFGEYNFEDYGAQGDTWFFYPNRKGSRKNA